MPLPTEEREITLQKTERVYVRLSLGIIAGLVLLVAVSWGGRRIYVRWQERKLMHQAHVAFDKNDLRWAAMAAQRGFSLDPASIDACRTLADLAEKQSNVEAIEWRRRAVAIAPDSVADRLALAKTALQFTQPKIAADALAPIAPAAQQNADYQSIAARIALSENKLSFAGEHLRAAVRFAPNDLHRQLELAEFQLHSDNRAQRDEGYATAMRLRKEPKVQSDAFHVLIDDALRHRDGPAAIELARELDASAGVSAPDRLLALGILRTFNDPAFPAALSRLQTESAQSAERAAKLLGWMNSHDLALLAIDWSKQLPQEMFGSVGFRFALADSFVQLRDWNALRKLLARGSWDRAEPLRLALEAKVARETGDDTGFEKKWGAALAQAEGDGERLRMLQSLAFEWKWPEKAAAVLWRLADNHESERDALQALYNYYASVRDTTGMYRVLTRLIEVMPNDLTVKNNFAQISLLLKAEPARALAAARAVHEAEPQNAAFSSTFAFGLFQNGDVKGALKVMSALGPEQLHDPSIATYYGMILAAAGQKPEAARYLDEAKQAKLLPEEERLVAQARAILNPPLPYSGI